MLTSLAIIFLCALLLGSIFQKLKLPNLIGMLITGIVLGPYILDLIDSSILNMSPDLRQMALIIILTRAGLSLNLDDLKKVGLPAILLSFIPATLEILAFLVFAPMLMEISYLDAAIMGTVAAAVSPAVIVPRMIKLKEKKYGVDKSVPQMIIASSSIDDVFVIVLFTALVGMSSSGGGVLSAFWQVPVAMTTGVAIGIIVGILFSVFFKRFHMRDSIKVIILLSFSFLFVAIENVLVNKVPFSAMLAVISMGIALLKKHTICAKRLTGKYSKIWVAAEILLFVLVGAVVDVRYAISAGSTIIGMIFIGIFIRTIGVYVCIIKSVLNYKEKMFCAVALTPKATVQAAIGAIPLTMGIAGGDAILTTAVLAILITAPLGALGIDLLHKRLLTRTI